MGPWCTRLGHQWWKLSVTCTATHMDLWCTTSGLPVVLSNWRPLVYPLWPQTDMFVGKNPCWLWLISWCCLVDTSLETKQFLIRLALIAARETMSLIAMWRLAVVKTTRFQTELYLLSNSVTELTGRKIEGTFEHKELSANVTDSISKSDGFRFSVQASF